MWVISNGIVLKLFISKYAYCVLVRQHGFWTVPWQPIYKQIITLSSNNSNVRDNWSSWSMFTVVVIRQNALVMQIKKNFKLISWIRKICCYYKFKIICVFRVVHKPRKAFGGRGGVTYKVYNGFLFSYINYLKSLKFSSI